LDNHANVDDSDGSNSNEFNKNCEKALDS